VIVLLKSAAARANISTRTSWPSFSASSAARLSQRAASLLSPRASSARAVSSASTTSSESVGSGSGEIAARTSFSVLTCTAMAILLDVGNSGSALIRRAKALPHARSGINSK
jgi:hypothetical protein